MQDVRTWVEIDAVGLRSNAERFLKLIPAGTRLMAVVKSNAYGHGLVTVAKILSRIPDFRRHGWFGVDSLVEGLRLRREGIKNPILVLGYTMPARVREAARENIALTISSFEALDSVAAMRVRPAIHIKIDTGMHRQGFFAADVPRLITLLQKKRIVPQGLYTHFASAKDPADPEYTRIQLSIFGGVNSEFERAGFTGMIRHAAASGGTLLFSEAHLDMVRVGMGFWGYWPSEEIKNKKSKMKNTAALHPVLTWKTIVSEVKEIPKGSLVGYDGTERVRRDTRFAVMPVGYWHGYGRGLSGKGEVLIRGRRARVLGRISMDMSVVDVTGHSRVRVGDEVVLIGKQGRDVIGAEDMAEHLGTTHYEVLTRINPLIRRVVL